MDSQARIYRGTPIVAAHHSIGNGKHSLVFLLYWERPNSPFDLFGERVLGWRGSGVVNLSALASFKNISYRTHSYVKIYKGALISAVSSSNLITSVNNVLGQPLYMYVVSK